MKKSTSLLFLVLTTTLISSILSQSGNAATPYEIACTTDPTLKHIWDEGDASLPKRTFEHCDEAESSQVCLQCELQFTGNTIPNGYVQQSKNEECDMGWKSDLSSWQAMCSDGQINDMLILNSKFDSTDVCTATIDSNEVKLIKPAGSTSTDCSDFDLTQTETTVTTGATSTKYKCGVRKMCGNGVKDANIGEACDPLDPTDSNNCSSHCAILDPADPLRDHRSSLPSFSHKNIEFWEPSPGTTVAFQERNWTLQNPINNKKIEISNQGRVITAPTDLDTRNSFSGVFLSNVEFDFYKNPDQVLDVHFLLQTSKAKDDKGWDDDYIGLVFGMHPGDANPKPGTKVNYLMLPWREGRTRWKESIIVDPDPCKDMDDNYTNYYPMGSDQLTLGGGLHLYHITGKPNYKELWKMTNCSGRDTIGRIPLESGKTGVWNRLQRNPLFFASPYYLRQYIDGGYNGGWRTNVLPHRRIHSLQMRAKFSLNTLEVWVNGQKTIDIDRRLDSNAIQKFINTQNDTQSPTISKDVEWPMTGQWGFYIFATDNFKADFRGFAPQFRAERSPDHPDCSGDNCSVTRSDNPTTTVPDDIVDWRCDRCGDGVVQNYNEQGYANEQCNFTDNDDYLTNHPGCSKTCEPLEGWACNSQYNYCVQLDTTNIFQINESGNPIAVNGVVEISGGPGVDTEHVPVSVTLLDKNDAELAGCAAKISPNIAKWSYELDDTCKLEVGKTYKVHLKAQGEKAIEITKELPPIIGCGDSFVQENEPYHEVCDFGSNHESNDGCSNTCHALEGWTCNPAKNYCVQDATPLVSQSEQGKVTVLSGELKIGGPDASRYPSEGTVSIVDQDGNPVCQHTSSLPNWSYDLSKDANCNLKPGQYTITITTSAGEMIKSETTFTIEAPKDPETPKDSQNDDTDSQSDNSQNNSDGTHNPPSENEIDNEETTTNNPLGVIIGGCSHTPALPSIPTLVFTTLGFAWMRRRKTK